MVMDPKFNKSFEDIAAVPLPERTKTYIPVGHATLSDMIEAAFDGVGYRPKRRGYYLKGQGEVMMGLLIMDTPEFEDLPLTVVFRNSYDKSSAAGIASGPSVSYCTNMCIAGEDMTFLRKHTKNVFRDLTPMIAEAAMTAGQRYLERVQETERMKALPIDNIHGYEMLGHLAGTDVLKPRMFTEAMREWKNPRFEVFEDRNAWSLYNAVTWGIKVGSPQQIVNKNPTAHEFFSRLVA